MKEKNWFVSFAVFFGMYLLAEFLFPLVRNFLFPLFLNITVNDTTYYLCASIWFLGFTLVFFLLLFCAASQNPRQQGKKWAWVYIPLLAVAFPVIFRIASAVATVFNLTTPLGGYVGFYYVESICLLGISFYYVSIIKRKFGASGKALECIKWIAIIASAIIVILSFTQVYFQRLLLTASNLVDFVNTVWQSKNLFIMLGYMLQKFFANATVDGFLGLIYGLLSVFVTLVGSNISSSLAAKTRAELKNIIEASISIVSLLAVAITLIMFGAGSTGYMHNLIPSIAIVSVLLSALFLSLGFLVHGNVRKTWAISLLVVEVISFATGLIFGSLAMPLTGAWLQNYVLYLVYPSLYFFMLASTIFITLLAYLLSDDKCPLSKIIYESMHTF